MRVLANLLPLVALAVLLTCSGLQSQPSAQVVLPVSNLTPVVFVSGVTGTKLYDPQSETLIWGSARQLVRPRDGGYSLALPLAASESSGEDPSGHPQARYDPIGPLWKVRFPGWTKEVYRPLRERFESAGYRYGDLKSPGSQDSLFFFDICRWLAKYGALGVEDAEAGERWQRTYRIRRLALAGVSNSGAMRVLQLLIQGRSYIPLIGRRFYPETFFSVRPLFEDLPAGRDDLFFDEQGETLEIDLFDAGNWQTYGWSVFGREASERLRRHPRPDLFGDEQARFDYLERQLTKARRFQELLARDTEQFPEIEYFLLENDSEPTMDRALVESRNGEWQTSFLGDRRVDRDPALEKLAAAAGDGHAVIGSQRGLSAQELAVLSTTVKGTGGHFEALIQPEALDAIVAFLTKPGNSNRK
jgi:hypothetical protein